MEWSNVLVNYLSYSSILEENVFSDTQQKALSTLLRTMDEGWGIIDRMTFGLLAGSLACANDKQAVWEGMDQMRKIFLRVNSELAEAMQGNLERVDLMSLNNEAERFSEIMKNVESSLSSLGLGLVTQFISRLPEIWMQQLDMVAMARTALNEMSESAANKVVQIHIENVRNLNSKLIIGALSMNSEPFRKIETWAKIASAGFDKLILQGYQPQAAYGAVVKKYGSPWA